MRNSVLSYLEEAAALVPERTALEDQSHSLTYREYHQTVLKIASELLKLPNVDGSSRPVAVYIDRTIESVTAFLGIAAAGHFYVPVDPAMPEARRMTILQGLAPLAVINASQKNIDENALQLEELLQGELTDEDCRRVRERTRNIIDTDPLYSIFTSGSTGVPKGVLISHRSVLDLVASFDEAFGFREEDRFANQAPFDFDVSVKDIYNALAAKATMVIVPKKLFMMPKQLVSWLSEKQITVLIWAVSAVRIVSDFEALSDVADHPLSLRYVMFSGEVMPIKALNYWMKMVPGAAYVNLYGPTEITCNCSYHIIDRPYELSAMLPIGRAFPNMRVTLRSPEGKLITAPKEVGEICVAGTGLALGYWNMSEKTAEVFTADPLIPEYRAGIYHTGDMGFFDEDGLLYFAARADSQIKHMGHRIELGELEAVMNGFSFLRVSCCLYNHEEEKIVCFYEADEECKKEIVKELSRHLQKYMWPNKYIHMTALPMNAHGKIDRQKLKELL